MTNLDERLAGLEHGRRAHARRGRSPLDDLERRLRETAAFCDGRAVAELRNLDVSPLPANRWEAVDELGRERERQLMRPPTRWETVARLLVGRPVVAGPRLPPEHPPGKLLLYFPDLDLHDGAAELESDGFFDAHNAPPRGTWVGFFDDGLGYRDESLRAYLLAWVPAGLVERAAAGIEVNSEECIRWLDDEPVALRELLRESPLAGWLVGVASGRSP